MDIVHLLAPFFERYITINGVVPGRTYNYAKRGFKNLPVMDLTMHRTKCKPGSWLYVALKAGVPLSGLGQGDKLYVGSQTADRMFRGDGLAGRNFHHAQMRSGNGDSNLETFVRNGGRADIYRASSASLNEAVDRDEHLKRLAVFVRQPSKHIGYWFEQAILTFEQDQWAWNTRQAESKAKNFVALFPRR
jgi:hypothetical protein